MLKSCVNARPTYCVRGLNPELTEGFASAFDTAMLSELQKLVNSRENLSIDAIDIKNLPCSLGGLSFRCLSNVSHAAWTASWLASLKYIREHLRELYAYIELSRFSQDIIDSFNIVQPQRGVALNNECLEPILDLDSIPTQHDLVVKSDQRRYDDLIHRLSRRDADLANWLISSSTKGISSWLHSACSSVPGLRVDAKDFLEALRLRLLLPIHDDVHPVHRRCQTCNKESAVDLHGLACTQASIMRKGRHDLIRDALHRYIRSVSPDAVVVKESPITDPLPESPQLVADLFVQKGNRSYYVDVTVTNPFTDSVTRRGIVQAAKFFSRDAETKKKGKYSRSYGARMASGCIPFAIESTGRLGEEAEKFLKEISSLDGRPNTDPKVEEARLFFKRRLAAILVTGNGMMIRRSRTQSEIMSV